MALCHIFSTFQVVFFFFSRAYFLAIELVGLSPRSIPLFNSSLAINFSFVPTFHTTQRVERSGSGLVSFKLSIQDANLLTQNKNITNSFSSTNNKNLGNLKIYVLSSVSAVDCNFFFLKTKTNTARTLNQPAATSLKI